VTTTPPENTGRKQGTGRFQPGHSGNPAGKPKGARHRHVLAAEALLDGEAEKLTRRAIDAALSGDMSALRLCLERIVPPRKDRPVRFDLPAITSAKDTAKAAAAVLEAVACGGLTPSEAANLGKLLGDYARVLEATEIEARVAKLEGRESPTSDFRG
jgi:Family of unknown function (DUF5681)